MLVLLGFAMIATFLYLVMSKRVVPVAALILVPLVFGLAAGGGLGLADDITQSIEDVAPTAALLFFAITFFGIMIDVGLFDPLIRAILRVVGHDPAKIVVGTALLASIVSLDGDGSTTFIIVTSAFLPIYLRLGMSPVVLTCVTATANGVAQHRAVGRLHRSCGSGPEGLTDRHLRADDPSDRRRPDRHSGLRLPPRPQ